MNKFADDHYVIHFNKFLPALLVDMKKTLEMITTWLKDSILKVNDQKTELCLFRKKDKKLIYLTINHTVIKSKSTINVRGVISDYRH